MTGADSPRDEILGKLGLALDRQRSVAERRTAVKAHVAEHRRNLIPARAQTDSTGRADQFTRMATEADATVDRVSGIDDVPAAITAWLRRHNQPMSLRRAPDVQLDDVPWDREPLLQVSAGIADGSELTGVTAALCAVSETGTLMLTSGAERPTTLNFLPENHIVVLRQSQIQPSYEEGWARLREAGDMPRTVNLVTGPSRSADIEQTLQLGAHGPRRLHIILVEDAAA